MSLDYNEKNITLAKNLVKMLHRRRTICGTISYQNMKSDFKDKKP
jgi:hypothetical protein